MLVLNVFCFFAVMFASSSVDAMITYNSQNYPGTKRRVDAFDEKQENAVQPLKIGFTPDVCLKRPRQPILKKKKSKHTMLYAAIGVSLAIASVASWYAPKDYISTSLSSYALKPPWLLTVANGVWKGAYHIAWPSIVYCGYRLITSNVSGSKILQKALGETEELAVIGRVAQNIAQCVEREKCFSEQLGQKVYEHTVKINKQRYKINQKKQKIPIKREQIAQAIHREQVCAEHYKCRRESISSKTDALLVDKARASKLMELK